VITLEADVLVDLVGNRQCIMPHAEIANSLEFHPREHASRRIAGRIDDDSPGT
jgi:hypothetical protein